MSLEVFGTDDTGSSTTAEDLWEHGWESDPDCERWWKTGEPEKTYSFSEAADIFEEWLWTVD